MPTNNPDIPWMRPVPAAYRPASNPNSYLKMRGDIRSQAISPSSFNPYHFPNIQGDNRNNMPQVQEELRKQADEIRQQQATPPPPASPKKQQIGLSDFCLGDTPNCYPHCSDDAIVQNILKLTPHVDIQILSPTLLLDVGSKIEDFINNIWNFLRGGLETNNGQGLDNLLKGVGEPKYGFFKMMHYLGNGAILYRNIPVFTSPQIQVNLSKGWQQEQSFFDFIKDRFSESFFGKIFEMATGEDADAVAEKAIGGVQNILETQAISPRLGPYFSFKQRPFDNNPSFSFTTHLINDIGSDVDKNKEFIYAMTRDALSKPSENSLRLMQKWTPSKLFNVTLYLGGGQNNFRIYNLCQASITVTPKGLIRGRQHPDAYEMQCSFKSLMPDIKALWDNYFSDLNGINVNDAIMYKQTAESLANKATNFANKMKSILSKQKG